MQPFAGESRVAIVLPSADPTLGGLRALLELEQAAFEAELGAPVELVEADPGRGARLLLTLDEEHAGPALMTYDPAAAVPEARAADAGGILEALNLLRTAVRLGGEVAATDCATLDEAIERVVLEVADTYPAFELRGLDWPAICARHVRRVAQAGDDPLPAVQRWLAELEDGHTWAWPPLGNLPYAVRVSGGGATFVRLRKGSAGWEAGVRPGWRLLGIDGAAVGEGDWLARAAAPPHSRPLIAGRRLLAGPVGVARTLEAVSPDGLAAVWEDAPAARPAEPIVSWRQVGPAVGYLRVEAWVAGIEDALDAALDELRACESLVLDLRGNPGGDLVLATSIRGRFLRERTVLGSIRYSVGGGELSDPFELVGEPAEGRWDGRLVVLADELTFSSSEDFLLGLAGLDHVTVVGRRSGGGSGRPRALRLLPGITLTVSTALTYDRKGRCVEGAGIPVDVEVAGDDDEMLAVARLLAT